MDVKEIDLLRSFVKKAKNDPTLLDRPEFGFFREFLVEMGATKFASKGPIIADIDEDDDLPPLMQQPADEILEQVGEEFAKKVGVEEKEKEEEDKEEDVVLEHGDQNLEVTDEMIEKSDEFKMQAIDAISNGNFDEAIRLFTEAIKLNPQSALLYARRAECFFKSQKPKAAINDASFALKLNPDSAKALKIRGKAYLKLGKLQEAVADLRLAMRIDFDETSNEELKSAEKKLNDEIEQEKRKREQEKQQQQQQQQQQPEASHDGTSSSAAGGFPGMGGGMPGGFPGMGGGFPGMGGGMPDISKLLQDPEILALMQNPRVMSMLQEMMANPAAAMSKYANDPLIAKLMSKFGKQ